MAVRPRRAAPRSGPRRSSTTTTSAPPPTRSSASAAPAGTTPKRHRDFVRIANKIALRKRQQRTRTEEIARLYQLEVIKLRMQMQEMSADRPEHASGGGRSERDSAVLAGQTL